MTALHCSQCGSPLPDGDLGPSQSHQCSGCGSTIQTIVFPAFHRPAAATKTEAIGEGESGCFFHPQKPVIVPCDECGRFLCALCRVEFGERNICPGCIDAGMRKGKLPALEMARRRYDSVALGVATFPAVMVWPTLLTAPLAIYLCVRHWNDPTGILPRSRWRFVAAMAFGMVQTGAWIALFLFLFVTWNRRFV